MIRLRSRWRAWVALCAEEERATVLAVVRIGVASVLLADLLIAARHGLVDTLWGPSSAGGFGAMDTLEPSPVLAWRWLGASLATTRLVYGVAVASALAMVLGVFSRTSTLVLAMALSQLAAILPQADRGIDAVLRNALFLLACSGCGRALSIDAWREHGRWLPDVRIPAWPRRLIVVQLLWMYFSAGVHKSQLTWWPPGDFAALYVVLSDPHFASYDFSSWLAHVYPLTQLATAATMAFEIGAPVMGLALWYRRTAHRGGRMRAAFAFLRVREVWLALGIGFHVALIFSLRLGIFPWGMLALYPAFLTPSELDALVARVRATMRRGARPIGAC
ncbi:HTTM domain-containing protein [Sandaracinus amylolyticus]|uniref:HTTM-like domain-containing protein n=1 Tax=Sandaracinus amylolyticus TaxID=927083 RepID=A0A0F6VZW4_9BACT|nr:HTTM domain-containing protein [Sandaracinus amylolyticus]AKF03886.1 hypothetical protein DB32_001035 [Sandaracinus amylolyticus]